MTEPDDLQRVLSYVDAADDSLPLHAIGPDLYVTSFWTPRFCAAIVRAAEAVGAFESQPDDPVPGHEVSLAVISPRLFEQVQSDIGERLWPQLRSVWPYSSLCRASRTPLWRSDRCSRGRRWLLIRTRRISCCRA